MNMNKKKLIVLMTALALCIALLAATATVAFAAEVKEAAPASEETAAAAAAILSVFPPRSGISSCDRICPSSTNGIPISSQFRHTYQVRMLIPKGRIG